MNEDEWITVNQNQRRGTGGAQRGNQNRNEQRRGRGRGGRGRRNNRSSHYDKDNQDATRTKHAMREQGPTARQRPNQTKGDRYKNHGNTGSNRRPLSGSASEYHPSRTQQAPRSSLQGQATMSLESSVPSSPWPHGNHRGGSIMRHPPHQSVESMSPIARNYANPVANINNQAPLHERARDHNPYHPLNATLRNQKQSYQHQFVDSHGNSSRGFEHQDNNLIALSPGGNIQNNVGAASKQDFSSFPPLSSSNWRPASAQQSSNRTEQVQPFPRSSFNRPAARNDSFDGTNLQFQSQSQYQSSPQQMTNPVRKYGGWAQLSPPSNIQSLHQDVSHQNKNSYGENAIGRRPATSPEIRRGKSNQKMKHSSLSEALFSVTQKRQYQSLQQQRQQQRPQLAKTRNNPKTRPEINLFPKPNNFVGAFGPFNPQGSQAAEFTFLQANNMLPMGKMVKGKQKIGKRKKILTPLKKQILRERLAKWRESQSEKEGSGANAISGQSNQDIVGSSISGSSTLSTQYTPIVFLQGYVHRDELEDDEEYSEIHNDLRNLSEKVGAVSSVFIPRANDANVNDNDSPMMVFVQFQDVQDALAARACWNGMILGGGEVCAGVISKLMINEILNYQDIENATYSLDEVASKIPSTELMKIAKAATNVTKEPTKKPIGMNLPATIIMTYVLTEDDLEDEDCMRETLEDIRNLAIEFGPLMEENKGVSVDREKKQIRINYKHFSDAENGVERLNGYVIGGSRITAAIEGGEGGVRGYTVCLENILSDDDYDDEECLEATREDIEFLASKYGDVGNIHIALRGHTKGRVDIVYSDLHTATTAVDAFDGMVICGQTVKSWLGKASISSEGEHPTLLLQEILTEDDFEDEDCLAETKKDVLDLIQVYGEIESFDIALDGVEKGNISIVFSYRPAAIKACQELNEKMIGGCQIKASILNNEGSPAKLYKNSLATKNNSSELKPSLQANKPEPMYSGDKVIPEQYAECKRAPKIPNSGESRTYAKRIDDESVVPLLFDMLGELMRLQLRAKDNKNAKARRRLVMGLREVCRGIRAKKVKMIVMANNLDQYGALDVKLQEILDLAKEYDLPVIFELNKRKIGKALGKTIKVSVVGIENADGAYEPFKKLKRLYAST